MFSNKELIRKYTNMLNRMKENRALLVDKASDEENYHVDSLIAAVAGFIQDLNSVTNQIPEGNYNDAPEGLIEITLEEWQRGMFHYCIEKSHIKQVRNNGTFDLRLFDVPNFENKKLGFAVMDDWFDAEKGKNRSEPIIRFCRYGLEVDWTKFRNRFAAQFAGDNS